MSSAETTIRCGTCGKAWASSTVICQGCGAVLKDDSPTTDPNLLTSSTDEATEGVGRELWKVLEAQAPDPDASQVLADAPVGAENPEDTVRRDVLIGRKFGDYEIRRRIGLGGMGIVYEAMQLEIGRKVAIKFLRPDFSEDAQHIRGLREEARAAVSVRHRGIIDIFNFGREKGVGEYIVMEFLEGESLEALMRRRGIFSLEETVRVLDPILSALTAAHAAGVIHRDLKPSNVFIVQEGDGSQYVKVLDFGLAKRGREGATGSSSDKNFIIGTPEYMAPEQVQREAITPRADLYSLGCMAFEMLTGQRPFKGTNPMETALLHMSEVPRSLMSIQPSVPQRVESLVLWMLAKRPEDRPGSAKEIRKEWQRALRRERQKATQQVLDPVATPQGAGELGPSLKGLPNPARRRTHTSNPKVVLPPPAPKKTSPVAIVVAVAVLAALAGAVIYTNVFLGPAETTVVPVVADAAQPKLVQVPPLVTPVAVETPTGTVVIEVLEDRGTKLFIDGVERDFTGGIELDEGSHNLEFRLNLTDTPVTFTTQFDLAAQQLLRLKYQLKATKGGGWAWVAR